MATSGTINGTISGYKPYLRINWARIETDVGGNRSKLRLQLYLMHPYTVRYSTAKSGVLQGTSFSSTINFNGTGSTLLRTQEIWVGHNADGSKTQSLSASYNINITYSGSWLGQLTVSGPAAIDAIPRGSTLSAFTFANSLQIDTANTINYTVARHSSTYRHQIQLRDGSVTIATWDNQNYNGSSTLPLTGTQVNTMLGRMPNGTTGTFTLRVATRSGVNGGWIGSAVTRNATVSLNDNVKPVINSTSATPTGNSWAVGKGFFVQGQTGVQADFSSNARGGAGVRSRSISIGNLSSGGSVVGSVFRHSQSRVTTTGDITITYTITDTRGRSASATRKINFKAYTPPQITSFTVGRSSPTSTTVNVKSTGSIHGIGGQNTGTMTVRQQGVTSPVRTISLSNTTPSFTNDSFNRTVATSSSVSFTITVTDALGNSATSSSTVGTAFMELSVRKGTGVGIGKVHEKGVLDVDGAIYSSGARLDRAERFEDTSFSGADTAAEWGKIPQGTYYVRPGNIVNQPTGYGFMDVMNIEWADEYNIIWYEQTSGRIYRKTGYGTQNQNFDWQLIDGPESGTTSLGNWVRFNDGTQICYSSFTTSTTAMTAWGSMFYKDISLNRAFPKSFFEAPTVTATLHGSPGSYVGMLSRSATVLNTLSLVRPVATGSGTYYVSYIAIGRWK